MYAPANIARRPFLRILNPEDAFAPSLIGLVSCLMGGGRDALSWRYCRNRPELLGWSDPDEWMMAMIEALRKVIKRLHYPIEVMLMCVRWYAAYPP